MKQYETLLRDHNMKATHQRMAILREIEGAGHVDTETLYKILHETFPSLALGTLYRNLNDLKDAGILTEVKLPDVKNRYEIKKQPHVHMVCEQCGSVEDAMPETAPFIREVEKNSGYRIKSSEITLIGICEKCAAKAESEEKSA